MLDVHIDDFYKDCAAALLIGFRWFPRQQTLFIEDISGPDEMDEFGLHSPRHMAALGAVQWLQDEGFVRFGARDACRSVDDFVLTSKAFARLMKSINADDPTQTLAHALEYARLQGDTLTLGRLLQAHVLCQEQLL
ncbi:hypothetical protein GCM10011297_05590 [Bacterioplanes sanyensis]|uniref:hypothetical protein n=1 Tax=Bacterioplanes sanyensis TaxID=1249553 RepID=UPI001675C585|nr:hypothetical protein [Bacterioplanes sanyensis]GGY35360.1 hypothetical protein GCM10011297_05590 [Bacterioplanes sanyensis]